MRNKYVLVHIFKRTNYIYIENIQSFDIKIQIEMFVLFLYSEVVRFDVTREI